MPSAGVSTGVGDSEFPGVDWKARLGLPNIAALLALDRVSLSWEAADDDFSDFAGVSELLRVSGCKAPSVAAVEFRAGKRSAEKLDSADLKDKSCDKLLAPLDVKKSSEPAGLVSLVSVLGAVGSVVVAPCGLGLSNVVQLGSLLVLATVWGSV